MIGRSNYNNFGILPVCLVKFWQNIFSRKSTFSLKEKTFFHEADLHQRVALEKLRKSLSSGWRYSIFEQLYRGLHYILPKYWSTSELGFAAAATASPVLLSSWLEVKPGNFC